MAAPTAPTFRDMGTQTSHLSDAGTQTEVHLNPDVVNSLTELGQRALTSQHVQLVLPGPDVVTSNTEPGQVCMAAQCIQSIPPEPDVVTSRDELGQGCMAGEQLHTNMPLWMRSPVDVAPEEYASVYKTLTNDLEDHLAVKHFSVDGQLEFRALLFVPIQAPIGKKKHNNIKFYVRRDIMLYHWDELMPNWLAFVKGVVAFEDLPLNLPMNVSQDTLQQHKIHRGIKTHLVKNCLDMISEIAVQKDVYKKFYEQFGMYLESGLYDSGANRTKVAELLRFHTSKSGNEKISLHEYVDRMQEGQQDIIYITGESVAALSSSPYLDTLHKKDLEVLYMDDLIEMSAVQQLKRFDGHKFKSAKKAFQKDADKIYP